jgi:acyl-CoA reductase-like NAD-dependent aldehyde dehydrogenase
MENYKMWIGGKWVEAESGKTFTVVNPVTEEEIAQVPLGDKEDVDKAVAAARKAFPIWSKKPQEERSRILKQIAASFEKRVQELVQIDMLDHGTPLEFANMFAHIVPHHFEYAAEVGQTIMGVGEYRPTPFGIAVLQREPIGVSAQINPWNVPLFVSAKISAALTSGNTCVVKAPSVDSLPAIKIAEVLAENDLPEGTVNLLTGPGSTVGEALASHPGVDMVAFTGSSETGKRIMELASNTAKRLFLELGGKNPFIVLEDADLDAAVPKAVFTSFHNSGMVCASPGRYYIHDKIYDEFVDKFVAGAKMFTVGDPNDPKTMMGPVVSAEHRDRVEGYIKKGIEEGAKLVLGGKRPTEPPLNKGYFIMPTVFTEVTQDMIIAKEEIFGPVACFLRFSSEDEVIDLANDGKFGLSASVWTKNAAKGVRFANALQAGTVWVNDHMGLGDLPWGGFKESGFGKEGSVMGLEEYTQVKVVLLNTMG